MDDNTNDQINRDVDLEESPLERSEATAENASGSIEVKELVELMVKALVDDTDEVDVRELAGEMSIMIEIRVSKNDIGKIIGKRGVTAQAMRTIAGAAAAKLRKRISLDIVD